MKEIKLKQDEYIIMAERWVFNQLPTEEAFKALNGRGIIAQHDNGNAYIIGSDLTEVTEEYYVYDLSVGEDSDPDCEAEFESYNDLYLCFCNPEWQPE